jgi:diguanylate cyclase (GGDEF)-like protein
MNSLLKGVILLKSILRKLLPLSLPISIIVGASILFVKIGTPLNSALNSILYFSYILLAVVILLSFMFNRSRVFFIASVIFIGQILLMAFKVTDGVENFNITAIRSIISIILPINITVIALSSDKGILSSSGKFRIIIVIFEYLFIGWVIISNRTKLIMLINSVPLHIGNLAAIPLSIFLIFCIAFILFVVRIIIQNLSKDRLFFGVLIAVFAGLFSRNTNVSIPIYFSAAGIILLICALHETYFLAYIDELTGLPSRRALKDKMMRLVGKYTIVMIDIDFFKKFNDSYGHDSGDEVLRFIGKCLKQIPGGGKSFRYGGEEFTVIFPGKNISEVIPYIEKLRENIAKSRIPLLKESTKNSTGQKTKKVSITISCGVAEKNEKHPAPYNVLKASDAALYRAKDKGRNCVSK